MSPVAVDRPASPAERSPSSYARGLLIGATAVSALCIAGSLSHWFNLPGGATIDGVAYEILIVLTTLLFFRSALAQPPRWRGAWLLIAAGLVAALLGSLASIAYTVIDGQVPSPSWADLFYLAVYPLWVAGLLRFPKGEKAPKDTAGFVLDTVAVLFGSGMLIAYTLIIPTFSTSAESLPSVIVAGAYPLGDVLLVFGLISLVVRRRSLPRDASIAMLTAALVTQVVIDLLFSYHSLTSGRNDTTLLNCLAALSWGLVAWAGYMRMRRTPPHDGHDREITVPSLFAYLVAYVAALAGFVVLLVAASDQLDTPLGVMIAAAVAVTPLLLARQALALRESAALHELKGSHETEARFRSLVTNSSDTILVTDADSQILYATPSVQNVLGFAPEDLKQRRLIDLVHPDDLRFMQSLVRHCVAGPGSSMRGEWRMCDNEGIWHFTETVLANLLDDPYVNGIVYTSRDIGERVRFQEELQHQAFHDALTGLANRILFRDRVEHALIRSDRSGSNVAVLFMDLDDFKLVNDSFGHVLGDALLVQVADRLRHVLRATDTAARLGGDEFAILLEDTADLAEACRVAQRARTVFEEPFTLASAEISTSASIGVAMADSSHTSAEELLRDADVAMYSAKAHGKDCIEVFEPAMQAAVFERLELANELRAAVERDEFLIFYQPIVEIRSQRIIGTEALVRWLHPRNGLLRPDWFIQVAEETGSIIPIGDLVLTRACEQLARWDDEFGEDSLRMAVNLSPRQIKDPELPRKVSEALAASGLDPQRLILEITETALVEDSHATLNRLQNLKALGVRLFVDDFGTGYSSLSYLRQFPVDGVKIAKPFVDHVADGDDDSALARAIISLGETLRLEVVAEGIEMEQQMTELRALGCRLGQGYYSSRPVSADRLTELLVVSRGANALTAGRSEYSPAPSLL